MANKITKTNVARLLDRAKIRYDLVPYTVDESDLSAQHIAQTLNENIDQVFKTIVIRGDKTGCVVAVVPGDKEVDLKKLAKISGNKKCEPLPLKELLATTGYIRGGCSPIGMKKKFSTFFHESSLTFPYIYVSAGQRGLQLKINPKELISYVEAQMGNLIE